MPTAPEALVPHFTRLARLLKLSALLNAPLVFGGAALVAAFASDAPGTPPGLILAWGSGFLLFGLLETVALPFLALRQARRPPHRTGLLVAHALLTFFLGPWGPVIGLRVLREGTAIRRWKRSATPAFSG